MDAAVNYYINIYYTFCHSHAANFYTIAIQSFATGDTYIALFKTSL